MKFRLAAAVTLSLTLALNAECFSFPQAYHRTRGRIPVRELLTDDARTYTHRYHRQNTILYATLVQKEPEVGTTTTTSSSTEEVENYDNYDHDWTATCTSTDYQYKYQSWNERISPSYVKKFKNHGIMYKKGTLSREEFNDVKQELSSLLSNSGSSLNLVKETTSSVAKNRIGAQIPHPSKIHDIFSNPDGTFMKLINEIHDHEHDQQTKSSESTNMVLSHTVPVELRIYETRGAGMEWHFDDVLYSPEQTEVVFTLENNSDCVTLWEERQAGTSTGGGGQDEIVHLKQVETEANSAIILKSGPKGSRHKVSPLRSGRRVILKLVYVRDDAVFLDGAEKHLKQFVSKKKKKR